MNDFIKQLRAQAQGKNPFYIKVKVLPKAPQTEIAEVMEDGTYKIRVAAPAEGGKANAALLKFLKKSVGAASAAIISGKTDRVKLVKLTF